MGRSVIVAVVGNRAATGLSALLVALVSVTSCERDTSQPARVLLSFGAAAEWQYRTHPSAGLSADEWRAHVQDATSRSLAVVVTDDVADPLAHRLDARIVLAEALPSGDSRVRVRVVLEPPRTARREAIEVQSVAEAPQPKDAAVTALGRALADLSLRQESQTWTDDELVAQLDGADPERSQLALELLAARRHPRALAPLLSLLRSEDDARAVWALGALVTLGDPRSARPIIQAAERRNDAFLLEALYALGSLGGEDAMAYLFMIDSGHPDPRIQEAARESLELVRRRAEEPSRQAP